MNRTGLFRRNELIKSVVAVHDNGARPFIVMTDPHFGVKVYSNDYQHMDFQAIVIHDNDRYEVFSSNSGEKPTKNKVLKILNDLSNGKPIFECSDFACLWLGIDPTFKKSYPNEDDHKFVGNTILIELNPTIMTIYNTVDTVFKRVTSSNTEYVLIGSSVEHLVLPSKITDFWSPIGNSDVPYPVGWSDNDLFVFCDFSFVRHYTRSTIDKELSLKNIKYLMSPCDLRMRTIDANTLISRR
jgi:hypothetical protein